MLEVTKQTNLRCFYCYKFTNLQELHAIDNKLKIMDEEYREFLLDQLPNIKRNASEKEIHYFIFSFSILNLCNTCSNIAEKKINLI